MVRFLFLFVFIFTFNSISSNADNHDEPFSPNLVSDFYYQYINEKDPYSNETFETSVTVDWAFAVNAYGGNVTSYTDGTYEFSGDKVTVGVVLPEHIKAYNPDRWIYSNDLIDSLYDEKINSKINELLLLEVGQLNTKGFFNDKPFELTVITPVMRYDRNDDSISLSSFKPGSCFKEVAGYTADYDIVIGPMSCFHNDKGQHINGDIIIVGYYQRGDLYMTAIDKLQKEEEETNTTKQNDYTESKAKALAAKELLVNSLDWEKEKIDKYTSRFNFDYWNSNSLETQLKHASSANNKTDSKFDANISSDLNVYSVIPKDLNDGYSENTRIIVDFAVMLNKDNDSKFIEDIDGNLSFNADTVKVGVVLPDIINSQNRDRWIIENDLLESLFNEKLYTQHSEVLYSKLENLGTIEYFNNSPYEVEYVASDNNSSMTQFELGNNQCYEEITTLSFTYDIVVAPACIFNANGSFRTNNSLIVLGYYNKDDIYLIALEEEQKLEKAALAAIEEAEKAEENKRIAYLNALESNPEYLTYLDIDDGRFICTLNTIPLIKIDAAIIDRWGQHYKPFKYDDVNSLFVEITQLKQDECGFLILSLADKEKLKKALERKSVLFTDDLLLIDENKLSLEFLNDHYVSIVIEDADFYEFFVEMSRDEVLFPELLKYNISNQIQLDEFVNKIKLEAPNLPSDTNQGIYDFILLDQEAKLEGLDASGLLAKRKEEKLAKEAEYARNNPYYAVVTCSFQGELYYMAACLTETTITLTSDNITTEKNHYNFADLGYLDGNALYIDLGYDYGLKAQNSSEALGISIRIYDRLTDRLLKSDEAFSKWGVASVYSWQ
jgi:hypothetical protein